MSDDSIWGKFVDIYEELLHQSVYVIFDEFIPKTTEDGDPAIVMLPYARHEIFFLHPDHEKKFREIFEQDYKFTPVDGGQLLDQCNRQTVWSVSDGK